MKTRALIAAFALSAIVLGSGVSAFAYNGYHNGNHAGMMSSLSPEKQGAYEAMMKDYYNRVSPIQDKLNGKSIELDALSRNPNAKPETTLPHTCRRGPCPSFPFQRLLCPLNPCPRRSLKPFPLKRHAWSQCSSGF